MDVVAQTAAATVSTYAIAVGHQLLGNGGGGNSSTEVLVVHIHGDRLRGAGGKAIAIGRGRRPGQFAIARIAVVVIRRLRLLAVLLQRNLWQ